MSLDQNLFTLNLTPDADNPQIIELIDPKETVHYRKERGDRPGAGDPYGFGLFDPLTSSLLATVTAPSASSKHKTIELHNPTVPIGLKSTGTFTFRWTFKWEEHEFEWKKEECFLIRKPDPPVLVAITKEGSGKGKKRIVQILDYNLNRFDINDRKGLEIVILSALLSFQDYADDAQRKRQDNHSSSSQANQAPQVNAASELNDTSPPMDRTQRNLSPVEPPSPEGHSRPPKLGVELIAEAQKGDLSEVVINEDGSVDDYAGYCANLLEADHMLFIILTSSSPTTVPKVLQVAHETKLLHHRAGSDDELYQYVQYGREASKDKKARRIIKLDNDSEEADKYKPPESLKVHLSKIILPELQPKVKEKTVKREKRDKKEQVTSRSQDFDEGQAPERTKGKKHDKMKEQKDERTKSKEGDERTKYKSDMRPDPTFSPKHEDSLRRLRKKSSAPVFQSNTHAHEGRTPGGPIPSASLHFPLANMHLAPPALPPRPPLNTSTPMYGSLRGYPRSPMSYEPPARPPFPLHQYPNTVPHIQPDRSRSAHGTVPSSQSPSQYNSSSLTAGSRPNGFLDRLFR